jgi:hypothetical protein
MKGFLKRKLLPILYMTLLPVPSYFYSFYSVLPHFLMYFTWSTFEKQKNFRKIFNGAMTPRTDIIGFKKILLRPFSGF